ncbi:hypothetical protein BDZ45DRAFT_354713 [Acephala macrosclerotiorum]|nr:hypothetical protein BDZ45DRAFT_354713 [Acephala macrosclerotiorum]
MCRVGRCANGKRKDVQRVVVGPSFRKTSVDVVVLKMKSRWLPRSTLLRGEVESWWSFSDGLNWLSGWRDMLDVPFGLAGLARQTCGPTNMPQQPQCGARCKDAASSFSSFCGDRKPGDRGRGDDCCGCGGRCYSRVEVEKSVVRTHERWEKSGMW